jgi:hypothetical protein
MESSGSCSSSRKAGNDGPVEILFKQPIFALDGLAWIMVIVAIFFVPGLR